MIKLRAIAECAIDTEKGRIEGSSEIHFGILAHLIVERGKPVARGTLVDAFWWNADESDGRHCLRQAIYKLRQMGVPIEGDGDSFMLGERAALADFDCADERALALSPLPPEEAVAIFPGYVPRASAPFLTWLERTREKAGRAVRGVLVRALGEARRRNGWDEAAKLARQCLVLDPLNEEATLTLAEYAALQGDKREALRLIDSYMEEIGGTYGDLRIPASLLRNRISERVAYPPASAAGKIPLVGREDSLRVLAGVSTEVSAGAGHTCVIHGPPGIGKTRLITEFANISAMKGARIVRVDCHADAAERALSVFMELAPQLLRMPGALGCSPEALRLVRRLGRHDPNERLDPDEYGGPAFLHAAVRASLRDLIDAIAAERPLYLLIEDVHWIDPVSLEVLKEIIGSNRGRALLVLMTARTLGDGTLLQGVDRRQLIVHELVPLGDVSSRRLVETLCGALAIQANAPLIEWCMQRGAGNPLFMTELLAHWRETRDTERVPASLEALIDERVGALSEGALRTLQVLALLEGEATYEMLEAVLGMQRWQVVGCVDELDKAGVVAAASSLLRPRHELLGKIALRRLSPSTSSLLHTTIALALQRAAQARFDPKLAWRVVTHWTAAGSLPTALALVHEAAHHLASLGSYYEAARFIEQAVALTADPDQLLRLHELRCKYLECCGSGEALIAATRDAIDIELSVHRSQHTRHSELEWRHVRARLEYSRSGSVLEEALRCMTAQQATASHRLSAAGSLLVAAYSDGDEALAHRAMGALRQLRASSVEERILLIQSELIFEFAFGSMSRAVAAADLYLETARASSTGAVLARALRNSTYAYRAVGNLTVVEQRLNEALVLARDSGRPLEISTVLISQIELDCAYGAFDRAAVRAAEVVRLVEKCPPADSPIFRLRLSELALTCGDLETCKKHLQALRNQCLPLRGEQDLLAVSIIMDAASDRAAPHEDWERLCTITTRLLAQPGQAWAMLALGLGASSSEQVARCKTILHDYAQTARREPAFILKITLAALCGRFPSLRPAQDWIGEAIAY